MNRHLPAPAGRVGRHGLRLAVSIVLAAALPSCLDIEHTLVLNPDGSGKITMTTVLDTEAQPLASLGLEDAPTFPKPNPDEQAREMVVAMLRAEGIDAWSQVSHTVDKNGHAWASVTGYFPDATAVRLSNPLDSTEENDDLGVSKTAEGHWLLEDRLDDDDGAAGDGTQKSEAGDRDPAPAPTPLTDEEIEERIDEERQQWGGMKAFMAGFFDRLRIAMTVQAGGTIVETAVFEKKDEHTASFEFTGKKLVDGMDALLRDDERAKALIKKGVSPTSASDGATEIFQMMFGGDGTMRVRIKPGDPAFDYPTEVARAQADVTDELRALLEDARSPARRPGLPELSIPGGPEEDESTDDSPDEPSPPVKKRRLID